MSAFDSWEVARRASQGRWVLVLGFAVLAAAFFKAQVIQHEQFQTQSAENRLRPIPLPAPRGEILDRHGLPLAQNLPGYSIRLLGSREDSLRSVIVRLQQFVPADTIDADEVVARWREARFQPALVFGSVDPRVVATLEEHRAAIPGLVIQAEPRREYPGGPAIAHLVGYIGEINRKELANDAFPGARIGELVGKQGLELEYDSLLRGQQGVRFVEVTAGGRTVRDRPAATGVAPEAGKVLRTTIDLDLQHFIDSLWTADLPDKRGAMLAMTPDGQVLAYYSRPTFDPNAFIGGISTAEYRALADDPGRPFYNRVIQGLYPPASPFKLAIAAMALRRGLVTMDSRMPQPCTGGYRLGNRVFKCWNHSGHGSLTLAQAIASSCDVYFYQLGLMLGKDNLLADGLSLGFASRSGIDLEEEYSARFPKVADYINSRGVSTFSGGEVLNLSIGQGRNIQTLANMVAFYAAIAGNGIKEPPYLVERRADVAPVSLGLSPEQLQGLRDALSDVVQGGTAAASGGRAFDLAGKTGTGQVSGQRDIGWFIGFAPASSPQIVMGIEVEEGEHGSTVAKYVALAIAHYLKVPMVRPRVVVTEDTSGVKADSLTPDTTIADTGRRGRR